MWYHPKNINFITLFFLHSLAEGASIVMAAAGPVASGYEAYAAPPSGADALAGEYAAVE